MNIEFLNWLKSHKRGEGRKKKNGRNEPYQAINPCAAILNKQKCHFFFSFTKSENRRAEEVLPVTGGLVPV
jgi:hypothetical protein